MRFKIKNTDVKISFSFFAVVLLATVSDAFEVPLMSFFASLIHELTHIFFIVIFKAKITSFSLSVFGGNIKRKAFCEIGNLKEAVISYSAPLVNIIIGAVFIFFSEKMFSFGAVNMFLGLFNIMPFYSFDGGRGLYYLLTPVLAEKTVDTVISVLSVAVTVVFSFLSIFVFFNYNDNYILVFMAVYMILSLAFIKYKL